ncbi:MAG: TSUP family transporter [Hyphomicrobiaceae bacterium]
MSPSLLAFLCLSIAGTALLSGIFGMAGGLILIGILLVALPLPTAMMIHAITQMTSNVSRAVLWRDHIQWRTAAAYVTGCAIAVILWSVVIFVPSKSIALLCLGVTPFLAYLLPARFAPDSSSPLQGMIYGVLCMSLMLLTGVAGPLLDSFFLGGRLDRREIVATKGLCQVVGHGFKLIYFGAIVGNIGVLDPFVVALAITATVVGSMIARPILQAMSDVQFRYWAHLLIVGICVYYVAHGGYLMMVQT